MNLIDKIFKIGLLLVALGFLGVYAYNRKQATYPGRFTVVVGSNERLGHTIYEIDSQNGTIYYANRDVRRSDEAPQWRVTNPMTAYK